MGGTPRPRVGPAHDAARADGPGEFRMGDPGFPLQARTPPRAVYEIVKTLSFSNAPRAALAVLLGLALGGCAATATRESTGEYVDDSAITAKVKSALIGDPAVHAFQIHVTTFRGVVQMSGFVNNEAERTAAQRDAQNVPGVRAVQDRIALKTP